MARYHINGRGEAGVCHAKQACPFGDSSAHYGSREQARQAFEASQVSAVPTPAMKAATHELTFTEADRGRHRTQAAELRDLLSSEGAFELPQEQESWWEVDEGGEDYLEYEEVQLGDFRLLASGANVNAYLHEPTATVYKVPHFESVGDSWSEDSSWLVTSTAESEAKVYAHIDHGALAEENITYTPTDYFTVETEVGPLPIIAQRYLEPGVYESVRFTGTEKNRLSAKFNLWDLNAGNVRTHVATGRLVLLDCVASWS